MSTQQSNPIKRGCRYDFSNISATQKDQVLEYTAAFLTEIDLTEFTDFVLHYAWDAAFMQEPAQASPFAIHQNLKDFLTRINTL